MNKQHTQALRQLRRSAGLMQDDIARILGTGGRSYVAMLEAGDRIPHVRNTVLLSMLFGTKEAVLFPQLYSSTKDMFRSNVRQALEAALNEKDADPDRLRFLRDALTSVELEGNVPPQDI
jgi:transcriptional regulator with XRE-family HTH domain